MNLGRDSATYGRPDLNVQTSVDSTRERGGSQLSTTTPTTASSPRRGEGMMMDRPLSTRAYREATSPQFWVNSASYSLFSGAETPRSSNILSQLRQDAEATDGAGGAGGELPSVGSTSSLRAVVSNNFSVVMVPPNDHEEFEASLKAAEQSGDWIECRETLTGRILWYNTTTNRLVFDNPPDGVRVIQKIPVNSDHELSYEDMITNRPIEPYENENVVDSLLSMSTHPWEFDENDEVDVYRAKAARRNHAAMLPHPEQYVFPEYFSQSPIPELQGNQFLARVRLPQAFSPFRQRVTVRVKVDYTTAADVITQAVDRLQEPFNEQRDCWVLKVVGREEYIYGRKRIVDYEAVRMAVRNESDVEFVLSQQTNMNERIEEAKQSQRDSADHFATLYAEHLRAPEFLDDPFAGMGSLDTLDFMHQDKISLFECDWNFRCKIEGLTNVGSLPRYDDSIRQVYVRCEVWIGRTQFEGATQRPTTPLEPSNDMRWGEWLSSNSLNFSQLPRESILCLMVFGICDTEHRCLGWSRMPLVDHRDRLRRGKYLINLWEVPTFQKTKEGPKEDPFKEMPFRYRGTTTPKKLKSVDDSLCQLLIEFDEFPFEVVAPRYPPDINYAPEEVGRALDAHEFKNREKKKMTAILDRNPLDSMTEEEKLLIWKARDILWHDPKALPVFLRSVDWTSLACVAEAHRYLGMWSPPKRVEDALEFLDYIYADTRVREFAVAHLSQMHDADLQEFLLQLVQCLKYEPHHDSALARLLIERGLRNPYQIGHFLFWHLKAEFHELQYAERFGVIMEEYLLHAGEHSRQLFIQYNIIKRFEIIADKIAKATKTRPNAECKKLLRIELTKVNADLPATLQIPLNPRWLVKKLNVAKCRFMSSKKVPLWLEFDNADDYAQDPVKIMFKSGDDLRQDILTLQVMTVMDKVWLTNKLDLRMKPYSVIATGVNRHGEGVGMLQIVTRSTTINSIYNDYGLYNEASISEYIRADHSDASNQNKSEAETDKARDNFARSCAGYCVATYVLGIGDRHSDNIMVNEFGQLFHIDFGHFLGNFKSKFGVKRERSPFVFTPQMKHAIDGGDARSERYVQFKEYCFDAYQVLRTRNRLFINLFVLMVSANMPELMKESDILYLKNMLNLHMDNRTAQDAMEKQINSSLRDFTRGVDNVFHNWKHRG